MAFFRIPVNKSWHTWPIWGSRALFNFAWQSSQDFIYDDGVHLVFMCTDWPVFMYRITREWPYWHEDNDLLPFCYRVNVIRPEVLIRLRNVDDISENCLKHVRFEWVVWCSPRRLYSCYCEWEHTNRVGYMNETMSHRNAQLQPTFCRNAFHE